MAQSQDNTFELQKINYNGVVVSVEAALLKDIYQTLRQIADKLGCDDKPKLEKK